MTSEDTNYWPNICALVRFAHRNGPDWKETLGAAWWTGDYRKHGRTPQEDQALLQRLRNDPEFGPGSQFWETVIVLQDSIAWECDAGRLTMGVSA